MSAPGTAVLVLAPDSLAGGVGTAGFGLLAVLGPAALIAAQVALAGVPEQVAFQRACLLVRSWPGCPTAWSPSGT